MRIAKIGEVGVKTLLGELVGKIETVNLEEMKKP